MIKKLHAITPEKYRQHNETIEIEYGFHKTPFGLCLIAITQKGVCHFSFANPSQEIALKQLQLEWPKSNLVLNEISTQNIVSTIFQTKKSNQTIQFDLFLKGTEFQLKVWKALVSLKTGQTASYSDIAHLIEQPTAVRAVATAIAKNPIAYLIPCHRVIKKSGEIHKYRWGSERKKELLDYESSSMISTSN